VVQRRVLSKLSAASYHRDEETLYVFIGDCLGGDLFGLKPAAELRHYPDLPTK
jgi:hypothetical protein